MRTEIYEIPLGRLQAAQELVDKMNKKAAKLGATPATLVEIERFQRKEHGVMQTYVNVQVEAGPIALAGWTFVATLDHRKADDGTYITMVRGTGEMEVPKHYFAAGPDCDHCRTKRFRRDTYVVHNDDEGFKQVGSDCIKDFLGVDPHQLIQKLTWLETLEASLGDADFCGGGGGYHDFELATVLAWTARAYRLFGFLGKAKARELADMGRRATATAERVGAVMTNTWKYTDRTTGHVSDTSELVWVNGERHEGVHEQLPEDDALAAEVLEYVKTLAPRNDYEYNLANIGRLETIKVRDLGLACSAIAAVATRKQRAVEASNRFAKYANSGFIGEVGKRLDLEVEVLFKKLIDNDFGTKALVTMGTPDGNILKTFASGSFQDVEVGQELMVAVTVKKHEVYNGRKETLVARAMAFSEEGAKQYREKAARKAAREAKKSPIPAMA